MGFTHKVYDDDHYDIPQSDQIYSSIILKS